MGTIKLDTITPLSTTTDITIASNKFVGSASGNMTVSGEGGTTQTNLQQGLAKVWSFCTDDVITDSLNTSGSTDVDTGKYTITFTNNTATSNVAVSVTCNENLNLNGHSSANSTSTYQIRLKDTSGNGGDGNSGAAVHGDLA